MCYSRKLAIEYSDQRGRVGSGERGEGGLPCPRARPCPFFCRQPGHTHMRSHPHVLRPPHHLFTQNSAENRRMRTPPARSGDKCRVPNPGGPRPPARHLRQPPPSQHKSSARRRLRSPPRPRCLPTRAFRTGTRTYSLSHTVARHTNYKLTRFRTCAGSTFVWARRMRRGGDGGDTMTVSARGRTPVVADSEPGVWCSGGEA